MRGFAQGDSIQNNRISSLWRRSACLRAEPERSSARILRLRGPHTRGVLTRRLFPRKVGRKEPLSWLYVGISWRKLRVLFRRIHGLSGDQAPVFWLLPDFRPIFDAPAAHNVTQDYKFFVVDGDGFCHLTAPTNPRTSTSFYSRGTRGEGSASGHKNDGLVGYPFGQAATLPVQVLRPGQLGGQRKSPRGVGKHHRMMPLSCSSS